MKGIIILGFILLCGFSQISTSDNSGFIKYQSKYNNFSIEYPKSWNPQYNVNEKVEFMVKSPDNNANFNIIVSYERRSLEVIADLTVSQLPSIGFKVISKSDVTINGIKFKKLYYYGESNGISVKDYMYIAIINGKSYTIVFTTLYNKIDQYKSVIDRIISSFRYY